jgi:hypothetical protein
MSDNSNDYIPRRARNADHIPVQIPMARELAASLPPVHEGALRALEQSLSQPDPDQSMRAVAQGVADLRFRDLVAMCAGTIAKDDKLKDIDVFALASGLSAWAIEGLSKHGAP